MASLDSATQIAAQSADWAGTERYQVVRLLVRGGMGCVYEAYDRARKQRVALKTLLYFSPTALFMFKQEFRALADARHPNLVRLHELVANDGERVFFSMEFVDGTDFNTYVTGSAAGGAPEQATTLDPPRGGDSALPRTPADLERLRSSLRQLVDGLQTLHAAGKLHRDIKPSNVLVTRAGRVVILDLGIAVDLPRVTDASLRRTDETVGTADYMAPEQAITDERTPASDWYSVGVLLYEALVGCLPFEGSPQYVIRTKASVDPVPPSERMSGVPLDLDALCRDLLARDPARRPTGSEIVRRLSGTRDSSSSQRRSARPPSLPPTSSWAPIVGRDAQLVALRDAFEATRAGRSVTVQVSGRAGMGKSALVRSFLDGLVERSEALVLRGRVYERESVPYKAVDAVIDTLSRHLMHLAEDAPGLTLPKDVDALGCLFPVLRRVRSVPRVQEAAMADPQRIRRRGFEALRQLMTALASRQPLVVSIDDVQWGDTDSVALLLELLRPPQAPPLLLVLVQREDDEQPAPFLRELRRRWPAAAELRTVSVGPLGSREACDLGLALLGPAHAAANEVAEAAARESGGSPFLIEELVRGSPRRAADGESAVTLDEVVGARLAQLPPGGREVVEMVAVGGRPMPVATLEDATGIEPIDGVVASLVAHRFIRSGLRDGREVVETAHDRIRETIVGHLSPPAIRQHHARLARALEGTAESDPEALAMHLIGAGENEHAGLYAEQAAERAASKLAFDQAVRLQRLACDSAPATSSERRRRMLKRLGEMLEWAGFGAEAARAYLEAAGGADTLQRAEFERAAAEQLLTCGCIDEGAAVLHRTLATAGLRTPRSPFHAVLSLLFYRAWVALVGLRFKERPADDLPRLERLRLDALFAAGLGFAIVDVVIGACIQARYLAMALRSGDRLHVLRAALLVSTQYANAGGEEQGRERALRALSQGLIGRTDSGEMHAFFHGSRGVGLFLRGRWGAALEVLDKAAAEYPNNRAGWQSNANLFGVYALLYMGRLSDLTERHERLLREAEQRGDLYTAVNLRLAPSKTLALAADDPEAARRHAREAMSQWSQRSYLVQHWQSMRVEAEVDLYVGDASGAYACIERDAPALAKSLLLKGQFTRILMAELRGRCALAVARAVPELRARRLTEASRCARRLAREKVPYAALFAAMLRAGIAGVRADASEADGWLHTAIGLADESGMILHAAAARGALGRLRGGVAGEDLVRRAKEAMAAQGVRAPERFGAMLIPGFAAPDPWRV